MSLDLLGAERARENRQVVDAAVEEPTAKRFSDDQREALSVRRFPVGDLRRQFPVDIDLPIIFGGLPFPNNGDVVPHVRFGERRLRFANELIGKVLIEIDVAAGPDLHPVAPALADDVHELVVPRGFSQISTVCAVRRPTSDAPGPHSTWVVLPSKSSAVPETPSVHLTAPRMTP